jgi:MFS family permease
LFYQFSGVHSLLIGLLPFYLPALMWQSGLTLADICWFVGLNGVGYLLTLYIWDRIRQRLGWSKVIAISLILELAVVSAIVVDNSLTAIHFIALLNGAYGCFFWMSQRLLFVQCTGRHNTGHKLGNFQIIVMILLKVGIVIGGYLWEMWGAASVLLLTLVLVFPMVLYHLFSHLPADLNASIDPPLGLKLMINYRDKNRSRLVFFGDGLFLFAESYLWVITLYFISGQDLSVLGVLVVSLSVLLAILFYIIKNKLDHLNPQRVYFLAVFGYSLSWLLRGIVDADGGDLWIYPMIVVIGFFTAFFRLAFNKRFFDLSKQKKTHDYIVLKSYYSQFGVCVFYGLMGMAVLILSESVSTPLLSSLKDPVTILQWCYWILTPTALIYLLYRTTGPQVGGEPEDEPGHKSAQAAPIGLEIECGKTAS